jgi:hypothetical protein
LVGRGDFAVDLVGRGDFAVDLVGRGDLAADLVRRFADPRSCLAFCIGSS